MAFPWIMWRLWKNRNGLIFESKEFEPPDIARKAFDDWNEWTQAQLPDDPMADSALSTGGDRIIPWEPLLNDWSKCNIGIFWCKTTCIAGVAWILRDWKGQVILHSRSSFAGIQSAMDANADGWLWAIESMGSLRRNKIIFEVEAADLLGAVTRPPAWPSFRWISKKIICSLNSLGDWKLVQTNRKANLPVFLIAKSVISENLPQSYVACGFPSWLSSFFV